MAGRLVVFEGPEGAGKSTQLRRLAEQLGRDGHDVVALREPGGTPLGDEIRRLLLDPHAHIEPTAEALLFMASRAQLVARVIRPALARGATVLLDRFFLSTYAYQVNGRGLPLAAIRDANQLAVQGLVPDLTLLLTIPAAEGLFRAAQRSGPDRMEQSGAAFHDRVSAAFTEFGSARWQARHPECGPIVPVDATGNVDLVAERVRSALASRWPETSPSPAGSDGNPAPVPGGTVRAAERGER